MDRPHEISDQDNPDLDTPGGLDQEAVEDRPNVGTTKPEAYPLRDRTAGRPDASDARDA